MNFLFFGKILYVEKHSEKIVHQIMIEFKCKYKIVYINQLGESTFCPVCDE